MDMVLTARMIDAAEAERAGLVSRIVPVEKLMEEALGAALVISGFSLLSVMAAKESVNRAFESGLSDGVMFERRLFHSLFATADQKEGMDAFLTKRAPNFNHLAGHRSPRGTSLVANELPAQRHRIRQLTLRTCPWPICDGVSSNFECEAARQAKASRLKD
jgi:hypothetical protein